ncbi:winged helix-turn-helix domain-containing protein [Micromonospora sp. NPDC047740]|uniref:winged helix-turn-helix domain-containing protein n=1 Tax=Micromonospora sp. NPDC047740 TaxID=3364254 RepID=UPI003712BDBE
MTDQGSHPRHGLVDVIHAPVRLSIVAALAGLEKAEFRFLRDTIEVSDSLLSKHLTTLEAAGYVQIVKAGTGRRPRTWVSLTPAGRTAFDAYTESLKKIIDAGT